MHCLEIILGQGYQSGKVVVSFCFLFCFFFISTDLVSVMGGLVWGLMASLGGTASHESGMFIWGLALEVEAPPPDGPGTHYLQAMQFLTSINKVSLVYSTFSTVVTLDQ